ncbi:MAG: glycosyltransferase family 4 protein [Sedimentisphaerales bacterium]|nr:glycosyltransferase family 4 protein [Sedimentisphaerales bacterium]
MKISFFVVKNIKIGGGIEKYTRKLGSLLAARGHEITVYSMGHYGDCPSEFEGMRVIEVPSLNSRYAEKISASITAIIYSIFQQKPDVVHFHSVVPASFAWLFYQRNLPCVLQMHGIEWQRSRWGQLGSHMLHWLEKTACKQSKICTAVSKVQCDYLNKKYGLNVKYIPTGADLKPKAFPREILKLDIEPGKYILFASRLVREKGAHYLISAFNRLDTDCKLVIAGDANGEDQYKQELYKLAENDSRIVFTGYIQGRLLDELFSNARLYVHPSEVEGLSIALLEAMSFGNICLASNIPENIEAIGEAGLTFDNKSVSSLHAGMDWALKNPDRTEKIKLSARERIKKHFSWEGIADRFEKLYEEITLKPASTGVHIIDYDKSRKRVSDLTRIR